MPFVIPQQPGFPMPQFYPNPQVVMDPHHVQAEMFKQQQEKDQNKEFKKIYDYVKKREKTKYKAKMEKLILQIDEANKAAKLARKKPEQRTVKLQTKKIVGFVNRGLDPIETHKEDQEISAQPEFRQESIEKAVSEKLDEIEQKAKEHTRKKKQFSRIYFRPQGNFSKHVTFL